MFKDEKITISQLEKRLYAINAILPLVYMLCLFYAREYFLGAFYFATLVQGATMIFIYRNKSISRVMLIAGLLSLIAATAFVTYHYW